MRKPSRRRSRPKANIEPIHVHELLNGAGMTGFLSVLAPPVHAPHLRQLGVASDGEPFAWAYSRLDAILAQARRQDEVLSAITEIARRIHRGAARLRGRAEAVRRMQRGEQNEPSSGEYSAADPS